jgi:hypothetical protein
MKWDYKLLEKFQECQNHGRKSEVSESGVMQTVRIVDY